MKNKITIVGDGNVGSSIALTLLLKGFGDEIVLIDRNEGKAKADSLDMEHAAVILNQKTTIRPGMDSDYADSTFIVITAAAGPTPGTNDRLSMLEPTKRILTGILSSIKESGFDGYLIIVSNPVDVMTYYAYKMTGLDRNKVIGTGTLLDTARLYSILSKEKNVPVSDIMDVMMLGEHGKTSAGIFSNATVLKEKKVGLDEEEKKRIVDKTNQAGWDIVSGKGNTSYGIAASVYRIVNAIYENENAILPVSHVMETEDVSYSLPCVLNRKGIDRVEPFSTNAKEKEELEASIASLREVCQKLF